MKTPKISVIIPVYNTARYFVQTVESILNQTYNPYEIIVVNDGSTDNFLEVSKPYKNKIHIINKKQNEGISESYNAAIKNAKGDWIAICDGDDYWVPNKLEKQIKLIKNNVGYIFCNKYLLDEKDLVTEYKYSKELCDEPLFSLLKTFFASPTTVLIKKKVFDKAGLFDNSFKSSEDYDMWIRIAAKTNITYAYLDLPLVYKRVRSTSIQGTQNAFELIHFLLAALDNNKELFKSKLNITEEKYNEYIGYNLGFLGKKLNVRFHCLKLSFKLGTKATIRCLQRFFKRDRHSSWYEGKLGGGS